MCNSNNRVYFHDSTFEKMVRTALGHPVGDISYKEMASIESLGEKIICSPFPDDVFYDIFSNKSENLHDISGIEYCESLKTLKLTMHFPERAIDSTDTIHKLCRLKSLTHLFLSGNAVNRLD